MTLDEYRRDCGWSQNEMARQAGIDNGTAGKALKNLRISISTADKLATAISRKLGRTIRIRDIEGLNVK